MHNGTARIRDIVTSPRTFSRLDEAALKTIDIHDGLDSVLLLLQNRCKQRTGQDEISILRRYGSLPTVECYSNQLNQACFNILANAIEALHRTPDGGGQIEITTTQENPDQITICITDTGPGIDRAIQSKMFNPFFTTKKVGEGTGMGLAVSYNIVVEEHGGELICESELGQGCTFTLRIPITQQQRLKRQLTAA